MTSLSGRIFPLHFILILTAASTNFDLGSLTLSSMKLLGDAHWSNGSLSLTKEVGVPYSGAGRVLYSKPIKFRRPGSQYPASFSTFFSFSIKNLNPSSIGGGLAFVISPDDEFIGDAGGYMGITARSGSQTTVVAVEFDTLMDVEFKDINGNHVGLDLNSLSSARVSDLDGVGINLKSGDLVNSWVDYSGSTRVIKIYVSYSNLKPKDPVISSIFDLNEFVQNDFMFVGFSGSTQGSTELHSIQWWSFSSSFDETASSGMTTTMTSPPPPPTASLMNPTADSVRPAPPPPPPAPAPDISNANTTSHQVKISGQCHNQLCKRGPGAVAGVVTAGAFFLAFCTLISILLYRKKTKNSSEALASDIIKMPKEFSYKEVSTATKGFDSNRVIGHGAFGTVYRGILPSSGNVVAVKRCSHGGHGKTEFLSELSIIATLRHRNLVRLQGWCHERGESLLVYDLMSNGSLDKALYESRTTLSWLHRHKILLGVASALAYLHQECENQVIHRDIKSSNIMLDEGFNARLGDFGLARQIEHDKSPDATVAAGTMGYLAPEYLLTGRATEKTDVFSYGAVVLEVVSGRRPIEREGASVSLVEWVWSLHREGRVMVSVDPRLGNEFEEGDVRRVLLVGLACSHPDPMARPTMRGVVQMLVGEGEIPIVPRARPTLSFSTSDLIMNLQDSVSDLIALSTSSSENGDRPSSEKDDCRGGGGVDLV